MTAASGLGEAAMGQLGDGVKARPRPVAIGQGFLQADVDNYGGRTLAEDGRLWAGGGSQRPRIEEVARDVTQVHGSIPVLMIRSDGGLWAWNEWEWTRPGKSAPTREALNWHGTGFVRLPRSRKPELAWRADGTAWAWGKTLAVMTTPQSPEGAWRKVHTHAACYFE